MLQLSQRPLAATDADEALFVDRATELGALHRAYRLAFNTLLLADRGAGTTSLVRRLTAVLIAEQVRTVHVDASNVGTADEFVTTMERALAGRSTSFAPGSEPAADLEVRIARLGDGVADRPLIVVDGAHDPAWVHTLFGRFRDELWELPFTWLVCGLSIHRGSYLRPPADAFFEAQVRLEPLDDATSRELVLRRLDQATGADTAIADRIRARLDTLVATAQGSPRQLLAAAREIALDARGDGASDRLVADAARLGRSAAMLATELRAMGAASASDPELLDRLGWTRARATQVFRDLLDAGVVVAHRERNPGSAGRPRTVYSLNTGDRLAS